MAGLSNKLYKILPVPLQHLAVSVFGFYWHQRRFGGDFRKTVEDYKSRELFTSEEWHAYSQHRLREILVLAYSRVPYYQDNWKGIVTLHQLKKFTVRDLASLPPLEKSTVRDNPQSLLVGGNPQRSHRIHHTSGSTGTPIVAYWLPDEQRHALALRHARYSAFAGIGYDNPRATFSGRMVEPNPESKGPFYRYNFVERQVYFSAFHLGPHTVWQYINALKRHKTEWITGYSHSIYQLAQLALDQNLNIPKMTAIITTSEKLTQHMRTTIERAFNTRVFEEYGCVENVFFACDNEYGQLLLSPDCGLVEIVDRDMNSVPIGTEGEVLATGFTRLSQPLIRYRVGDMAAMSDEKPKCGRGMPVLKEVLGRIEDTVYGPDGRRMVRFHGIFVDQPNVREGQIIQERVDRIRVKIVPKPSYGSEDDEVIILRIQQRLTKKMNVVVEKVSEIPRNESGKFRAVVNNLSESELKEMRLDD